MAANTGNKGFSGVFKSRPEADDQKSVEQDQASTPTVLEHRSTALSKLAAGEVIMVDKRAVDPAACIMWERHNREYAALTAENCADLIQSIKGHSRQEIPAIVRRLKGHPTAEYEVICGARRHWAVSWLRENGYPETKYLIEVRHLSDREAFRLSDLENRDRKDISPYERAVDYLRALTLYYDGVQSRMADDLHVDKSYVSRMVDFAKLPRVLFDAFGSPHIVPEAFGRQLSSLIKDDEHRAVILNVAEGLKAEQESRISEGKEWLPIKEVLANLLAAGADDEAPIGKEPQEFTSAAGKPMLRFNGGKNGAARVTILPNSGATHKELRGAFEEVLKQIPLTASKRR